MAKKPALCMDPACEREKRTGVHRCEWHWLMKQPVEVQIRAAKRRLASLPREVEHRPRVPEREWPAGHRWCAGCQGFVPLFYARGSRCVACASRGSHESHIRRTYEIEPDEYDRLLAWQGNRCYTCGRNARTRRLAIDHDHETNTVRGLLCSDDRRGCNHAILGNIIDLAMARRIVDYLERSPLERMRAGEPPPTTAVKATTIDLIRASPRPPGGPHERVTTTPSGWLDDPLWTF